MVRGAAYDAAVVWQRTLAEEEHVAARKAIEIAGCEFVEADHDAFVAAVQPLLKDARAVYGDAMFRLLPSI